MASPGVRRKDLSANWRALLNEVIEAIRAGGVTPAKLDDVTKIICKLSPVMDAHGSPPEVHAKSTASRPEVAATSAPSPSKGEGDIGGGGLSKATSSRKRATKKPVTGNSYSEQFLCRFWDHWNGKGSKAKSAQIWEALSPEDQAAIEIDLKEKRREERDHDWSRGFQPHATTYLNGRLWEEKWDQVKSAEEREREKRDAEYERIMAKERAEQEAKRGRA